VHDAVERVLAERAARRGARLRTVGLTGAVLLHAAVVAAAVVVPRLTQEEREPLEFVAVTIVPAAALGNPRATSRAEPEPETAPEPVVEEPEPEPVPPEPETEAPPPLPTKEPEPRKPEPKPEPRRPAADRRDERPPQPAAGRDEGAERGTPRGAGSSSFGLQLSGVGDPTFTYGYYLDRMLALIERNWRRPPTDGVRLEVAIDFTIRRDGTVEDLEIAESSGYNAFDLAGYRAVQTASPLPPLPAGYRKDALAIRLIIR